MGVGIVGADVDVDAVTGYHTGCVVDGIDAVGGCGNVDGDGGDIFGAFAVFNFVGEGGGVGIAAD